MGVNAFTKRYFTLQHTWTSHLRLSNTDTSSASGPKLTWPKPWPRTLNLQQKLIEKYFFFTWPSSIKKYRWWDNMEAWTPGGEVTHSPHHPVLQMAGSGFQRGPELKVLHSNWKEEGAENCLACIFFLGEKQNEKQTRSSGGMQGLQTLIFNTPKLQGRGVERLKC